LIHFRRRKEKKGIGLSLLYERISLFYFGKLGKKLVKTYQLDNKLEQAMSFNHPVVYASKLLMNTFLIAVPSLIISVYLFIQFKALVLNLKAFGVVLPILILFAPILYFLLRIAFLNSYISSRAHNVESELPLFASYLTSMVVSGIGPQRVIEAIAESDLFDAIKKEAQLIKRNMRIFGLDSLSAIESVAKNHPSKEFREFMIGYVSTIRGGGDVVHYLQLKTESYFKEKERDMDKLVEGVGTVLSTYMIIFVVVGLTINIIIAVQGGGLSQYIGSSMSATPMIVTFNFILMPIVTIFSIIIVGGILPKYNVVYKEPYLYLGISIPLSLFAFSILMALGGYRVFTSPDRMSVNLAISAIGIAFILASIPPMLAYRRIEKMERNISRYLGSFLTDLSEIRKAGLNPEKSIIYLSSKDYGSFTPILRKLSSSLQVGVNMRRAVRIAIVGYKNWFMRTIMRMLVDIIEYGGGTPQLLDTIASYGRKLSDFENQLKTSLRSDVFLPYIGSILNIVSTVMIIYLMVTSLHVMNPTGASAVGAYSSVNPARLSSLTFQLLLGLLMNSWLAGLLVGKSISLTVAGGFKHAVILVTVSLAVSLFTINILLVPIFSMPMT
jgi:flagellar protein FlaJ